MTNRTTGEPIVRGGGEGVVVNFDDIQNENEEVKEKNEKLNEEIEQLRALNSKLQSQLQYFQSLASSIGAVSDDPVPRANGGSELKANVSQISGPNHVPVSQPFRILPNPNPQAQATRRILLYNHPHTNNNGNTLPISTNTNNNAFSGNMSIDPSASLPNLPFRSSMPNALPSTQWAQPHLPQGLPAASQNTTVAYPLRSSQVQSPMQDDAVQSVPIQDANNKGMNRGMQMRRLQDQGVQGHHLPMARFLDAQHDQVYQSSNTNTQQKKDQPHQRQNPTQNANELPTPNKDQGTYTHSLKTLNQSFQIPPHFLLGDAQNQSLQNANTQHEVKDAERQDFSNARLLYRTTLKNYPFDFPASLTKNVPHQATQSLQQPIFQFQGSGHQNANSQNLGYSNTQCHLFDDLDILGAIKKDYDGEEKFDFDFEPGFCWTPSPPVQTARPIPTTNKNSGQSIFSSIDLDTINEINQSSAANAGDKSASITIDDDIDVPYQTRELSSPEILSLLLAEMEEGVSQQKQSQPPVNGRVQELDQGNSDSTGDKEESQGNDDGDSDCFIAEPPQDIDMDLF